MSFKNLFFWGVKMTVEIIPSKLHGEIKAISSKSDIHRLIICSAFSDKKTEIKLNILSEDIMATLNSAKALGADFKLYDESVVIYPIKKPVFDAHLNCNESGSTIRFLIPVAAALSDKTTFYGTKRLSERPLDSLKTEMGKNGCLFKKPEEYEKSKEIIPIITVSNKLKSGIFNLPGNVSSQFISGLIFTLPLLKGNSIINITPPFESKGYVKMTIETVKKFGIIIENSDENIFKIKGNQQYKSPGIINSEGDWSNSAFWIAANCLGNKINCIGLSEKSVQPDMAILKLSDELQNIKNEIIKIDAAQIPDLIPIVAFVAAAIPVKVRIYNAARLRIKESDRLYAVAKNIKALGGDIEEFPDELLIHGKNGLNGGKIDSFNDHRIVMAAAILSTASKNKVIIYKADAVNKSYPSFFEDFKKLGGIYNVI